MKASPNSRRVSVVAVEGTPRNLHPILRDEVSPDRGRSAAQCLPARPGARVEVEIRYDERQLRLRVRDDGKGIDPKLLSEDGRAGHYGCTACANAPKLSAASWRCGGELDSGTEVELSIPASHASETSAARRRSWLTEKLSESWLEKTRS